MRMYKKKRKGHYDGRNGGLTRASKLTPQRRKEIAMKAARARWVKKEAKNG